MTKPDINFDCPHCGQNLEAPGNMAGLFVECPTCSKVIKVPAESGKSAPAESKTGNQFAQPPPREEEKSSTMRIDLPPDFRLPPPTPRRFIIRRSGSR
ncbi:MAG: hypothetical protein NZ740_09740 [Kiritimatiellae bacterium]|nr:hypothetical protein [Kiritimatiellia bacterium]MDW8459375.1 hypothetical protein [Verrucomicrobiota bacterium]